MLCNKCDIEKLPSEFYPKMRKCKACHNMTRSNYKRTYTYEKKGGKWKNSDNIEKIKELRLSKMKWSDISKELNIPYLTVINIKNSEKI